MGDNVLGGNASMGDAALPAQDPGELPRMYQEYAGWSAGPDFEVLATHANLEEESGKIQAVCFRRLGLDRQRGREIAENIKSCLRGPGNSIHVPKDRDARGPCHMEVLRLSHELLDSSGHGWGRTKFSSPAPNLEPSEQVSWKTDSTKVLFAFAALLYRIAGLEGPNKRRPAKHATGVQYALVQYAPHVPQSQPPQQVHPSQLMPPLQPPPPLPLLQASIDLPMRPAQPARGMQQQQAVLQMNSSSWMDLPDQPMYPAQQTPHWQPMCRDQQMGYAQSMFQGQHFQPDVQQALLASQNMPRAGPPQWIPPGPQHSQFAANNLPAAMPPDPKFPWSSYGSPQGALSGVQGQMGSLQDLWPDMVVPVPLINQLQPMLQQPVIQQPMSQPMMRNKSAPSNSGAPPGRQKRTFDMSGSEDPNAVFKRARTDDPYQRDKYRKHVVGKW